MTIESVGNVRASRPIGTLLRAQRVMMGMGTVVCCSWSVVRGSRSDFQARTSGNLDRSIPWIDATDRITSLTSLTSLTRLTTFTTLIFALLFPALLSAQAKDSTARLTRILFILDCSNSMNAFWGTEPKINAAREVLLKALPPIENARNVELALRMFGNHSQIEPGKQDCDDSRLEVPFGPHNGDAIRAKMRSVRCLGTTPIARSLQKAAGDFPDTKSRNVIILITDGIEACDEDPCAVSRALQAKGIILKPFVIGLGLEDAGKYSLKCVGNYYDAGSPEMFDHVLKLVIDQALNGTTTQLLLLADDGKPTETDVPVTFYDQKTGEDRYDFVHTLNVRGEPDTLSIDPVFTYRIMAHTIPPSVREHVTLEPGSNNVIALVAGQGTLDLRTEGPPIAGGTPCIVRMHAENATLNVQPMNSTQLYRTGLYDLEVLTLPRLMIPNVAIKQSAVTPVIVPRSGVLNIIASTPGPGAVFQKVGDELKLVVDLNPFLARNQFFLLPGDYRVIYRSGNAHETVFSVVKDVTVTAGRSVNLEL